jgi:sporulation protein YlmC with PRC-barrel domain
MSGIRGIPVITLDDGTEVGSVSNIYIDESSKRLSAVSFKHRRTNEEAYVEAKDISVLGHDVILIRSESSVCPAPSEHGLGRQFRSLRGTRVTTDGGKYLGDLEDFDLSGADRTLSELYISGGLSLMVEPSEVTLGPDAIIVPAASAQKVVQDPERKGLFARVRSWTRRAYPGRGSSDEEKQEARASARE